MKASGFVERPKHERPVRAKPAPTAPAEAPSHAVQRLVVWDDTNKVYSYNSDRPSWRAPSERAWTQGHNTAYGTTYTKLPYDKLDMARGHEMSFDQLQINITNYLNHPGPAGEANFRKLVATLILQAPAKEQKEVNTALEALVKAIANKASEAGIVGSANKLLGLLNSLSPNVRPVDTYVNSYIGESLDPHFEQGPSGMSLNQHGKNLMSLGADVVGKPLLSPGRTSVISSSEGRVPLGNMTPTTHGLFSSFPTASKTIGSDNVKSALYKGTLANTRARTQTTSTAATQPVSNSNTSTQPSVSSTTSQPTASSSTTSQPSVSTSTTSHPIASSSTTSHPTVSHQTATQPTLTLHTAPQPTFVTHTAPQPTVSQQTTTQSTHGMYSAPQATSFHQPMQPTLSVQQQQWLFYYQRYQQLLAEYQQLDTYVQWYWQRSQLAPPDLYNQHQKVLGQMNALAAWLWPSQ